MTSGMQLEPFETFVDQVIFLLGTSCTSSCNNRVLTPMHHVRIYTPIWSVMHDALGDACRAQR
jgi:hypothetical protein